MTRAFEVTLTIPDNEALTALTTLRRLEVEVGDVRRADVWRFVVDAARASELPSALEGLETIFNPNKHRLRERSTTEPEPGEVWIAEPSQSSAGSGGAVAGRHLPGVKQAERLTGWRLFDLHGRPAGAEIVDRAVETLLCNPAFQRAIR